MPPQQSERPLDVFDHGLDFSAHFRPLRKNSSGAPIGAFSGKVETGFPSENATNARLERRM
jgi:hypothetical protein